jgi:hypothetical protein
MAIEKYLTLYAEPEAGGVLNLEQRFSHCLVIPAYNEEPAFLDNLEQLAKDNQGLLIILVINQPDNVSLSQANLALVSHISSRWPLAWQSGKNFLSAYSFGNKGQLLVVDRFNKGAPIPEKQGVGLARKIGSDIACRLIHDTIVESPWIFTSDADAILPTDYFTASTTVPGRDIAALVYPFRHQVSAKLSATRLYELSLHYYVAGLQWAGSPYGYHTIGSSLAIHYQHYTQVRGFPKRAGGEDFYILNKLRKTGDIASLQLPCITILERESNRVPFGTGPAVKQIRQLNNPLADYRYYHPAIFGYLRIWLQQIPLLWEQHLQATGTDSLLASSAEMVMASAEQANISAEQLTASLKKVGTAKMISHAISHSTDLNTFKRHMLNSFDAFKTLKLIHELRNSGLVSLSLKQVLEQSPPFYDHWCELSSLSIKDLVNN